MQFLMPSSRDCTAVRSPDVARRSFSPARQDEGQDWLLKRQFIWATQSKGVAKCVVYSVHSFRTSYSYIHSKKILGEHCNRFMVAVEFTNIVDGMIEL